MELKEVKLGVYKHAKTGNLYRVLQVAKHSETLADLVIYEALYDNPVAKIWVRPLEMFTENVEVASEIKPRFEYLGENS